MALSPVSLTLNKKSLSIRNICFYNNDEKTDMLPIYGVWQEFCHRCGCLEANGRHFKHLLGTLT
jgi:hypothetical protein